MNHKLIFLDIDGTLTEPGSNTPPPSALEAVRRARAAGHRVFLCSGRNRGMLSALLRLGFDGAVCSAGGHIECGGRIVYDCPMTPEQQTRVLTAFRRAGVFRTAECLDSAYTDEGLKDFLLERAGENSELLRWRRQVERDLNIRPMAEYRDQPIYKIVFMAREAEDLRAPRELLEEEFQFCLQEPDRFGVVNGELINRKFHKGSAVRRLCAYLNVPLEDTVAFGDSMNDLEMIETAALGVCMGNGSEALKKAAGAVCPPQSEDGLYRAFARIGLLDGASGSPEDAAEI